MTKSRAMDDESKSCNRLCNRLMFFFVALSSHALAREGVGAKERSGGRKPAGRCIISAFSLKSGKHKCLKAERGVIGHDRRDRAKKEN